MHWRDSIAVPYNGIAFLTDSVTVSGRKTWVNFGTLSGGTNNAYIADNAAYTGNWFINQTNGAATSLSGTVSLTKSATTGAAVIQANSVATVSVAAGNGSTGTITFTSNSNGLILLSDQNSAHTALILLTGAGGGTVTIISDPAAKYSIGAPSAGDGLIHLSSTASALTFTNETGSALAMNCIYLRIV